MTMKEQVIFYICTFHRIKWRLEVYDTIRVNFDENWFNGIRDDLYQR